MVTRIVDDDPQVWVLVRFTLYVAQVWPEEGVSLGGGPDALYDVVAHECVLRQPLHHVTAVQGGYSTQWFSLTN